MNCAAPGNSSKHALIRRRRRTRRILRRMYKAFREFCERVLRIPPEPGPPPGDGASTRVFTAAPNYYKYLLFLWGLRSLGSILIPLVALGVPLTTAGVV